jgi:eukaryotic-like serine/threonine-protein kinase
MGGGMELGARDPREVGPYRLLKKLGGGGQGTVYLGTDGGPEPVAVKVLNTDFHDTGRLKSTLNRELESARSVAAFVTAGVITFDLDADPPYIVTEFVDGPTLQDEVLDGRGPLRGSRLADLSIQTVIALEAIHGANVVHCDFKPANIILGPGGVKVIDFGIARAWEQVHQAASRVIGSAHFMAPEQVDNRPLGPAVDMFAWASTMVFAATGQYAFEGNTPLAVGVNVVQSEPKLHGLTGPLADLVLACLNKDPRRRPTAAQARQTLMAPAGQRPAFEPIAYQPGSAAPSYARANTYEPEPDTMQPAMQPAPAYTPARTYPTAVGHPVMAPPQPAKRRGGRIALVFLLVLLILGGAGVTGYLWWDRTGTEKASPKQSTTPADPDEQALQAFAGRDLGTCGASAPNNRQLARRSCTIDGQQVTYALFKPGERAVERKRVVKIHDGSETCECLKQTAISPDGRRGQYIEYTYQASDDKKWYVAVWWDDGETDADGAGVMTMRAAWDRKTRDAARPLRDRFVSWRYQLTE